MTLSTLTDGKTTLAATINMPAGGEKPRMIWTKLSDLTAAAARIAVAGTVGMAAVVGAALIIGPALLGHRIEPWVSKQPQNLAFVAGLNHCHAAARRQRDFGSPIPPECANSRWNAIVNPPPPGEAPTAPGDAAQPPDDAP